jgi:hypothetical protein
VPGKLTDEHKAAIKIFRERRGESETLKKYAAAFRQHRRLLVDALKTGSSTVPALAVDSSLPTDVVLWHIAGMRKYGLVQEIGTNGDYVTYELVSKSE